MRILFFSIVIILVSLNSNYGQSLYRLKQDCCATYNKKDFEFLMKIIVDKDEEALKRMIAEGRAVILRKNQIVYLHHVFLWTGAEEIRPLGATYTLWIPAGFIEPVSENSSFKLNSEKSEESSYKYKMGINSKDWHKNVKIYLKNGNVIKGEIVQKTERGIYVKILNGKGMVFIQNSKIRDIEEIKETSQRIIDSTQKRKTEVDEECILYSEYCYVGGYEGGIEDRENGYPCSPEEYYNLPLMTSGLEYIKQSMKRRYLSFDEHKFDRCCKKGFIEGYRDGYYGRPKKRLKYSAFQKMN